MARLVMARHAMARPVTAWVRAPPKPGPYRGLPPATGGCCELGPFAGGRGWLGLHWTGFDILPNQILIEIWGFRQRLSNRLLRAGPQQTFAGAGNGPGGRSRRSQIIVPTQM
ncbi:hypothetical protein CQ10_34440 [Bradyrhizobium valentinum]|uniref:Uncharacterized protein n=1 Tax=Bradyrhizobium valentinum TaxID=1518501 RepID=A0A0R3KF82_9BRAD|nr:hypothetical protein CQ10_34440 [Bradyrhizobium valentinum]KRR09311.1 hypothetical protein CP49_21065 [Bradyrhizobium valentinum]